MTGTAAPDSDGTRKLYYPVVLVPGRSGTGRKHSGPFTWGEPASTIQSAESILRRMFVERRATIGFLVCAIPPDNGMEIMIEHVIPREYRFPIRSFAKLIENIDKHH